MTVRDLLDNSVRQAEVADRRVEALRLAATVGRAREFYEREVQRGIDRYERAVADFESAGSGAGGLGAEGTTEVSTDSPSG